MDGSNRHFVHADLEKKIHDLLLQFGPLIINFRSFKLGLKREGIVLAYYGSFKLEEGHGEIYFTYFYEIQLFVIIVQIKVRKTTLLSFFGIKP